MLPSQYASVHHVVSPPGVLWTFSIVAMKGHTRRTVNHNVGPLLGLKCLELCLILVTRAVQSICACTWSTGDSDGYVYIDVLCVVFLRRVLAGSPLKTTQLLESRAYVRRRSFFTKGASAFLFLDSVVGIGKWF